MRDTDASRPDAIEAPDLAITANDVRRVRKVLHSTGERHARVIAVYEAAMEWNATLRPGNELTTSYDATIKLQAACDAALKEPTDGLD
jgi:hypothetical protein